jgi:hypothetical protein
MADQWESTSDAAPAAAAPAGWESTNDHSAAAGVVNSAAQHVNDFANGVVGTAADHVVNAYDLIRKIPGLNKLLPDSSVVHDAIKQYTPTSGAAKAGKFAENVAEFAIPAGEVEKASQGLSLLGRTAAQAGVGAGVSAIDSGGKPAAVAEGAALGAAGPLVGRVLEAAAPVATKTAAAVLGRTTGAGAPAMEEAAGTPSADLVKAMRGSINENDILGNFREAVENVKADRAAKYQTAFQQLPQNLKLDVTPVKATVSKMLDDFGVEITPPPAAAPPPASPIVNAAGQAQPAVTGLPAQAAAAPKLDFSRSTITDPKAQNAVKSIVNDLASWGSKPDDLTPAGVDTLKRRIGAMWSDDSQASAFIAKARSATTDLLQQNVPGYTAMTKDYEDASHLLDLVNNELSISKNPGTALRKLSTVVRQNSDYRRALTDSLAQYTNADLKGQLAGAALNKGGPQGLAPVLDTGVGILGALAHGYLSPLAATSIVAASPRLMGELMVAMSKVAPRVRAAAPSLTPVAQGVANASVQGR